MKFVFNCAGWRRRCAAVFAFVFLLLFSTGVGAAPLRRPVSPDQPMWLVHIDTWNYADPQQIIDLIPEDVRPYVVMNISLSISHDTETSQFQVAEYGYEIAKSWARVCAENNMWCMIQQASGGMHQFSDFDLSVYEEFFREYPNVIGFNYAEQFWGFDDAGDPVSADWTDRMNHFANLLELCNQYGGYLVVSWCGNQWSPSINPIGMLKRNANFAAACRKYTENYILCEKYTQQSYQYDMESLCLGAYLSGYSGQYGIRYDDTGWTDPSGEHNDFTMATAGAVHLEHVMLTGETVIDGPELIWTQCFRETGRVSKSDGFSSRNWTTFSQFDNVSVDLFRKIIDGTVRIPTRQEVIDRTKYVVINNVNDAWNADNTYSSPETLFEGLYRMDGDGNLRNNKTFFKKSGRYPTIPTVYALDDSVANSFQYKINKSAYSSRWPSISSKVNELNSVFPEEYTGDLYAGRHENGWVVYNPYKVNQTASASIPFKYNTCERMDLSFSQYTAGVVKEYADQLILYLSNYDNELDTGLKTDVISIYGSTAQPTFSYTDRASHQSSAVSSSWVDGVFTLTVKHNGPIDLTINCAGTATDRLTEYTPASISAPEPPMAYYGPRQNEGECFEYKSIEGIVAQGQHAGVRNYTGQGYLRFGTSYSAAARDKVTVLKGGTYRLETRYAVTGSNVNSIDLYVNGTKAADLMFTQTGSLSNWAINEQEVVLNEGENTIEYRAVGGAANSVYLDNFVVRSTSGAEGLIIEENEAGFAGVEGMVESTASGFVGDGYSNTRDEAGVGAVWTLDFDSTSTKSFTFRYASTNDLTGELFVNGTNWVSGISFPSTGSLSSWDYVTVYAGVPAGESVVRLQAMGSGGLPNLDSIEVTGGAVWTPSTPSIPPSISANASSISQIELGWGVAPGAISYTLKRALVSGGPYETIAEGVTDTVYGDSGLAEFTSYFYVVSAVNGVLESADSAEVMVTTKTTQPPMAPTGGSASAVSFDQANISWAATPGAEQYIVKRSITSGGPYIPVAMNITETSFSDRGLFADTLYYYVISAENPAGESPESAEVVVRSGASGSYEPIADTYVRDGGSADSVFGASDELVVKTDGGTDTGFNRNFFLKFDVSRLAGGVQSVQLKLTPFKVDSSDAMNIQLVTDDSWSESETTWNNQPAGSGGVIASASGFSVGTPKTFNITSAATAQATGDGILSLKMYKPNSGNNYVGFSSREASNSALRPIMNVTFTHTDHPVADAPLDLMATVVSTKQVDLSWTVANDASSYNVYRSSSSGGPYSLLAVGVSEGLYSDVGLAVDATYYYIVRAVNGSGESVDSPEICVVTSPQGYQESNGIVVMEAESGNVGDRWTVGSDATASGGAYIEISSAYNWTGTSPENTQDESIVKYDFTISSGGNYRFWFRMHTTAGSYNDDSFFWRIDNGSWTMENGRSGVGEWFSTDTAAMDNLGTGAHVLEIAYREDGTRLDKFIIQLDSLSSPSGNGPEESMPPLPAPSGLTATSISTDQIDLVWNSSASAQRYQISRSTVSGGPYTVIASNIIYSRYRDQIDLVAGMNYYYVVKAVNAGDTSEPSNEAAAVPSAVIVPEECVIADVAVHEGTNMNLTTSNSVPGHFYSILGTENLLVPDWQRIGDEQEGTGFDLEFIVPLDGMEKNRFFRLDVSRP
ncbi:MAG: DNRLRE domain-containing protein [Pontiellaceae bacterium]|nr:DNRLRE domain-containing protein [Pontiellaceae bacterium]